jgi:hypothetical protein
MVRAIVAHQNGINAQAPAASSPPQPFAVAVQTIPITRPVAFEDRWLALPPAAARHPARAGRETRRQRERAGMTKIISPLFLYTSHNEAADQGLGARSGAPSLNTALL